MSNFMTKNFYKQRRDFEKSARTRDKKFSFPDPVLSKNKYSLLRRWAERTSHGCISSGRKRKRNAACHHQHPRWWSANRQQRI